MTLPAVAFELHITFGELVELQSELFHTICREEGGKPVWIELSRGRCQQQPMFSKVLYEKELGAVHRRAEQYQDLFMHAGIEPKRLKIEVPFDAASYFRDTTAGSQQRYYEWHGKVPYERLESLLPICEMHQAHVSRNALKQSQNLRFITLRERGTPGTFKIRVAALCQALREDGREVSKEHFEYCLLDSNVDLDRGWLIP